MIRSNSLHIILGLLVFSGCASKSAPQNNADLAPPVVEENPKAEASEEPIEEPTPPKVPTAPVKSKDEVDAEIAELLNNAIALLTTEGKAEAKAAIKELKNIEGSHSNIPEIPYNLGVAYLIINKKTEAKKQFIRATDIDPKFSVAWYNLGALAEKDGELQRALLHYETGLSHNPKSLELVTGKINILRKKGDFQAAVQVAKDALKANKNNVGAYNAIARVYLDQNKPDQAEFILTLALEKQGGKSNPLILTSLGKVYYMKGNLRKAHANLLKAIDLQTDLVEARSMLGLVLLDNRAWKGATDILLPAYELEKDNPQILNSLGIAYRGQGEYDKAESFYKKALKYLPKNPDPLLNISIIQAEYRKNFDKATALLDEYKKRGGTQTATVEKYKAQFARSKRAFEVDKIRRQRREEMERARRERDKRIAEEEKKAKEQQAKEQKQAEQSVPAPENSASTEEQTEKPQQPVDNSAQPEEKSSEQPSAQPTEEAEQEKNVPTEGEEKTSSSPPNENKPEVESGEKSTTEEQKSISPQPAGSNSQSEDPEKKEGGTNQQPASGAQTETEKPQPASQKAEINSACNQLNSCGDPNFLQCSHAGKCSEAGRNGTYEIGSNCSSDQHCAFGLKCVESQCSQGDGK